MSNCSIDNNSRLKLLDSLDSLSSNRVLFNAIKVGAYNLKEKTRDTFRRSDIKYNKKQESEGVSMSTDERTCSAKVYLTPKLYMHWFEKGTRKREDKNGRNLGLIRGRRFFAESRAKEDEVLSVIFNSIDNQLKNI